MTTTANRLAAFTLSALATFSVVFGVNAMANSQYAAADSQEMARYGQTHVAVQHVTVVGRRADA